MIKKLIIIFLFGFFIFSACSKDKPILRKNLEDCSARDILEYGRALFNSEYYKDAIVEYHRVLSMFPKEEIECSWSQYELAYSYYYMKDYKQALMEFKKVEMLYPNQRGPVVLARKMMDKITVLLYE